MMIIDRFDTKKQLCMLTADISVSHRSREGFEKQFKMFCTILSCSSSTQRIRTHNTMKTN